MSKLAFIVLAVYLKRWYEKEKGKLIPDSIIRNVETGLRVNIRAKH